jgi:hypothetical protein
MVRVRISLVTLSILVLSPARNYDVLKETHSHIIGSNRSNMIHTYMPIL